MDIMYDVDSYFYLNMELAMLMCTLLALDCTFFAVTYVQCSSWNLPNRPSSKIACMSYYQEWDARMLPIWSDRHKRQNNGQEYAMDPIKSASVVWNNMVVHWRKYSELYHLYAWWGYGIIWPWFAARSDQLILLCILLNSVPHFLCDSQ